MILSAETLKEIRPVFPFYDQKLKAFGRSFGLSQAGYDVRLMEPVYLGIKGFALGVTIEAFNMPNDVMAIVHDKSTNIRMGIAVHNTVIEPGWRGYLTVEISNHKWLPKILPAGMPIAQIIFHRIDRPAGTYDGKYQNQGAKPTPAILD